VRRLLEALIAAIPPVGNSMVLMGIVISMYAVLGQCSVVVVVVVVVLEVVVVAVVVVVGAAAAAALVRAL